MTIKVGINGFGRIGRLVFRAMMSRKNIQVVGINDLFDADMLAYMLKYDSTQGICPGTITAKGNMILVDGKEVPVCAEKDPAKLPWGKLGVDVVIESTGRFTNKAADGKPGYDSHLAAGAKRVLLSAPAKDKPDATISSASTTTSSTPRSRRCRTPRAPRTLWPRPARCSTRRSGS